MTIEYQNNVARFTDTVTIEEADGLLAWLASHPDARADLADCTHCHAAILQLLMAARPVLAALPRDAGLAIWLGAALP
ncbi:hypothetical protein GCM10027277_01310 [Pseudoduganella ginsengisoli]|uniref:Uncharacterized protein n=1 Tax=Pseudoduganella ginsengisoli TaxID=1462440 RepID=A0A6L6QAW2_9BURK|nr:hypothetical protein [Pseudoduganella ginsengisoli]MTW06298.1 hypothetical protein [Pseudoduganella ginsengisoli]